MVDLPTFRIEDGWKLPTFEIVSTYSIKFELVTLHLDASFVLANIWSQLIVHDCPVVGEYIVPTETRLNVEQAKTLNSDATWYANPLVGCGVRERGTGTALAA